MRKLLFFSLCAASSLMLAACGNSIKNDATTIPLSTQSDVQSEMPIATELTTIPNLEKNQNNIVTSTVMSVEEFVEYYNILSSTLENPSDLQLMTPKAIGLDCPEPMIC